MSNSERTAPASVALAGFVSGVLGFACAPGVGGIVAIVLGWTAHQELSAAPHARGRRLALGALGLGTANVVCVALAVSVGIARLGGAATEAREDRAERPALDRSVVGAPRPSVGDRARSTRGPQRSTEHPAIRSVRVGQIELVDVGSDVDSLAAELERQMLVARRTESRLLLWVSAPGCAPCAGVASALPHHELQRALERTRLVRVNRDEFAAELDALGIPFEAIPGFALFDAEIRPVDYVDGGEWDEDVPHNIAPVLAGFMRGNYNTRRRPWRGATRRKITAL